MNKLLPIIGFGILLEATVHILHGYSLDDYKEYFDDSVTFPLVILSLFAIYTLILVLFKRLGILKTANSFGSRLAKCLLICTVILILSPFVARMYWIIVNDNFGNYDWTENLPGLLMYYLLKVGVAIIVAILFSIRLQSQPAE